MQNFGLKPLPKDDRDFKLGAVFNLPKLEELPNEFIVGTPAIKNQEQTDFCSAFASSTISELQEEVELAPEWVFAASKTLSGAPEEWGQDLRTICKTHTKIGAPEAKDVPFNASNKDAQFLRYIKNYPTVDASKHKKESYFKITGQYDSYDNIRASLWKFKKEKRGVIIGVMWSWPSNQSRIQWVGIGGYGHALAVIGWNKKGMIVQNSWGKKVGDDGLFYISREVINHFVDDYGAFMFVDMPKEDAQYYIDNNVKVDTNWLLMQIQVSINAIAEIIKNLLKKMPEVTPTPAPEKPKNPLFLVAKSALGTDVSPKDLAPDELGCAESVCNVIRNVLLDFPIITGTWTLWGTLRRDSRFTEEKEPQEGDIVISPTATGNGTLKNGHTGIVGERGEIMSNDSNTGKFQVNYTIESWREKYQKGGGFPVKFYRLKV